MPAAAPRPETQEEILAAALAARDDRDIPAEDDSWVIVDSDGDRPAELAGLDGAELDELIAAAPAQPARQIRPAGAATGDGPGGGPGFAEGGVLDVLAPGVALAGCAEDAHAGLAGLTDDELVGVLRAWARQESWAQARKLAAVAELARRRPADCTPPAAPGHFPVVLSEFTADEVALALTLTRRSAGVQLDLALALATRPAIAALLEAGQIDLLRVRIIIDGIAGLAEGHAAAVEAAVLPEAPGMTSGQLRAAVAQAVLAADPDAARRQREEDLKDARVECWTDPAGTANLAGRSLPCAADAGRRPAAGPDRPDLEEAARRRLETGRPRPGGAPAGGRRRPVARSRLPGPAARPADRHPARRPAARRCRPRSRRSSRLARLPRPRRPGPTPPAAQVSPARTAPTAPAIARTASPPPDGLPRTSRQACAAPDPAMRCRRWPGRCS